MKSFIFFVFPCLSFLKIDAQEIIVPVELASEYRHDGRYRICEVDNIYFKDVNKVFDKFVGNWVYKNEDFELEISLKNMVNTTYEELCFETNIYDCINLSYIYKKVNSDGSKTVISSSKLRSNQIDETNLLEFNYIEPSGGCCDKALDETLKISVDLDNPNVIYWKRTKDQYETCRGNGLCFHEKELSREKAVIPSEMKLYRK